MHRTDAMASVLPKDYAVPRYSPRVAPVPVEIDAPAASDQTVYRQCDPAPNPYIRLRRIVERLGQLADPGDDALWLAGRLAEAGDSPDGRKLATALELLRRPGQRRFEKIADLARRDETIRELAERYPGMTERQAARRIVRLLPAGQKCSFETVRRVLRARNRTQ